jgi:hypothetical protein
VTPVAVRATDFPAFNRWLGILDDYRTFWIDPDEGVIEEFEHLMAGK